MAEKEDKKEEGIVIPEETVDEANKPPEGYSEEDWADLSDEEKEGILQSLKNPDDDDLLTAEKEEEFDEGALTEIAGEEEKPVVEKPAEEKPAEEKPAEEKPAEEKPVEEKPAEEKPAEPERAPDEQLLGFKPFVAESEIDVKARTYPELQTKLKELKTKFDAGDIADRDDYETQRDVIKDQINQQTTTDLLTDRERVKADLVWNKETRHFLDNRSEYLGEAGEDGQYHPTEDSTALYGALSETITRLGKDPKFSMASGMTLLIAADKQVKKAFGRTEKPKEEKKEVIKEKPKGTEKPPAPLPEIKTLADIPNAAPNTTEGAFAQIDKLRGEDYEAALERLTPAQRAAYEDDADRRRA